MRLKDRIALVTGASRGIGRAVAERYAREGAHVIATARTVGGLEELDDAIKAAGGSATLVPLDLAKPNGIEELGQAIFERWKKLDVLVANAAVAARLGPLSQLPPKDWEESVTLNLTANWRLIRSLEPLLRASEAGRAIFRRDPRASGLFRRLFGDQGRPRGPRLHLVQGDREDQHQGQPALPRRRPHPDAGRRLPRRGPRHRHPARGDRRGVRRPRRSKLPAAQRVGEGAGLAIAQTAGALAAARFRRRDPSTEQIFKHTRKGGRMIVVGG